ncbi:hypothetical protein BH23GEM6_BH23GEM6_16980 [soil metagenome]
MAERNPDPSFDPEQIEEQDPLGEQGFAETGFSDAPDGGPDFNAPDLIDASLDKKPGGGGQKVAGIPEARQKIPNSSSRDRPDSEGVVIRERGGDSKGDPAVGGTRSVQD